MVPILMRNHEDHETLHPGCPWCTQIVEQALREYRFDPGRDRDLDEAMYADRELMRDEFGVR